MEIKELIEQVDFVADFFKSVPEQDLKLCEISTFNRKERLAEKGRGISICHLVIDGRLSIINNFENGKYFIYKQTGPNSVIGEMELAAEENCFMSTVECASTCRTVSMPKDIYTSWLDTCIGFSRDATKRLARMMCFSAYKNGTPLAYSTDELLALIFIDEYIGKKPKDILCIADTRETLAARAGVSLRTIHRVIRSYNEKGFVTLQNGKICINHQQYEQLCTYVNSI